MPLLEIRPAIAPSQYFCVYRDNGMHIGRDGSEQPPCDIILLLDFTHKTIGYGERTFDSCSRIKPWAITVGIRNQRRVCLWHEGGWHGRGFPLDTGLPRPKTVSLRRPLHETNGCPSAIIPVSVAF